MFTGLTNHVRQVSGHSMYDVVADRTVLNVFEFFVDILLPEGQTFQDRVVMHRQQLFHSQYTFVEPTLCNFDSLISRNFNKVQRVGPR